MMPSLRIDASRSNVSLVGLTRDYVETRHASTFTAECHVLYKRELTEGDLVRVESPDGQVLRILRTQARRVDIRYDADASKKSKK